ncbi:UNVERIFIED_CONTAM: CBS domain-containing protein CBSX3, mitochondrial [Sesamum radiatum]|uniref:CBS domain-containing protein CBSX3, mitochondrial n=1 Tax=Sesamum radiatum TaxID=300843 RepID=A0AAW2PZ08_SESRA
MFYQMFRSTGPKMQSLFRAVKCSLKNGHIAGGTLDLVKVFPHSGHARSSPSTPTKHRKGFNDPNMVARSHTMPQKGLQNTTVADVLMTKGDERVGSWLWCRSDDTVYDAVKQMAQKQHRIIGGSKARRETADSRDFDRKSLKQNGVFMLAENHIRHAPVINGRIVGMISIVDVVRAVLEQQHGEVRQLNEYIQGDYH